MKTAFTTFACPKLDFLEVVELAVRFGFDGIEFRCDGLHAHRVEAWSVDTERAEFRRILRKRSVQACCLSTSLQMIDREVMEPLRERIELASEIDCDLVRIFGGPVPDGVDRRLYHSDLVDNLRRAVEIAEEFNVRLALETHDGLSLGEHIGQVLRAVDHPKLGVLYDPLHPFRKGESPAQTFAGMGDRIFHCHMHDGSADPEQVIIRPVGEGDLPLTDIVQRLQIAGYDGYLAGEWFFEEYGIDTRESLERYLDDLQKLQVSRTAEDNLS